MKNLIMTFAFVLLFAASNAAVYSPGPQTSPARETIKEALVYPKFAIEEGLQGTLWLTLQIKDDGRVEVITSCSNCNELLRYALSKIAGLVVTTDDNEINQPFTLKVDFILQ